MNAPTKVINWTTGDWYYEPTPNIDDEQWFCIYDSTMPATTRLVCVHDKRWAEVGVSFTFVDAVPDAWSYLVEDARRFIDGL